MAGDGGTMTVGVAGLGPIGMRLARGLDGGEIPGLTLTAVAAGDLARAAERVADFAKPPQVMPAAELASAADIVVECAPKSVFETIARSAVEAGRIFVPLSVGALLDHMDLVARAKATGARIHVPTGAIIGLDVVRAMAVGQIHNVTLETRKHPRGLEGAPHLVENGIDLSDLAAPRLVFSGTAREAAKGFPANVNVAAALSLAGVGPDLTTVEVWADPSVTRNIQSVRISADSGEAEMTIRNVPSEENPRTGKITALSVIAMLRRITAPLVSGT